MPDRDDPEWIISTAFTPPAAEGLPDGALDSATAGADAVNAWALRLDGRTFLAHALVQLARDGWLRRAPDPAAAFDPSDRSRAAPLPQPPRARTAEETP